MLVCSSALLLRQLCFVLGCFVLRFVRDEVMQEFTCVYKSDQSSTPVCSLKIDKTKTNKKRQHVKSVLFSVFSNENKHVTSESAHNY